jgi:hypothetical protein
LANIRSQSSNASVKDKENHYVTERERKMREAGLGNIKIIQKLKRKEGG